MIQSRQVEAFRATGGMTAAAQMIHVTQPAVSRLVRDLEAELGLRLFYRRSNFLVPTAEANSLLKVVERSFLGVQHIQEHATDLRSGRGGLLKVAALPAMAAFMPRFAAMFSRGRPRVNIFVDSLPSSMIREQVASGNLDIGVTSAPFMAAGLTLTPIDDTAVVALPHGHRLARKRWIEAKDLDGDDLILLTKFKQSLQHPVGLALQAVFRQAKVLETPLSSAACVFVTEGAGIAIVDPFSASEFVGRGVVLRPFKPSLIVGTAVVHSSERALSIIASEFHTAFVAHTREFLRRADYVQRRA